MRVEVEVCVGTSCHLMGSMDLLSLLERMNEELGGIMTVCYSSCLGRCGKGPNIILNGQLLTGVTPAILEHEIRKLIRNGGKVNGEC